MADSIAGEKGLYTNYSFTLNKYELRERKLNWAFKYLGLNKYNFAGYNEAIEGVNNNDSYEFKTNNIVDIKGYDYMVDVNNADSGVMKFEDLNVKRKVVNYATLTLNINGEQFSYQDTVLANQLLKIKHLNIYTAKFNVDVYGHRYLVPPGLLAITQQNQHYKVTLVLDNFSFGKHKKEAIKPMYVGGVYLIKKLK